MMLLAFIVGLFGSGWTMVFDSSTYLPGRGRGPRVKGCSGEGSICGFASMKWVGFGEYLTDRSQSLTRTHLGNGVSSNVVISTRTAFISFLIKGVESCVLGLVE